MELPPKILIISASEDDVLLLVQHLQNSHFRLEHEQVDTLEALETALSRQFWDTVLYDSSLPCLPPVVTLQRIRQHDRHVPLIFISDAVDEAELVQYVKLGVHDIVIKDNLARLKSVIERGLTEAQTRREKIVAEARLITAIESIAEGMALFDGQDRLTLCNRRYREILDKCSPLIIPRTRFEDLLRHAVTHGQFEDIEDDVEAFIKKIMALRHKFGGPLEQKFCGERWIKIEDRPTPDGGIVSVLTDITERKRLDLMKDEFVSVVGHELRTPLTTIKGSLSLLEAGTAGTLPDQVKAMISIAHKNSDRLTRIINDILDLKTIRFGNISCEFRKVAVRPLLEEAASANESYANDLGISLTIQPMMDDFTVIASHGRLMQVLTNLISNAIKFSPSSSTVTLGARQRDSTVRISVADQGIGIAKNFHDRVFQSFSQADGSDRRAMGGAGLGLAIAKAIVERHGGQIGFNSAEGNGATFFFDLPLWQSKLSKTEECGTLRDTTGLLSNTSPKQVSS